MVYDASKRKSTIYVSSSIGFLCSFLVMALLKESDIQITFYHTQVNFQSFIIYNSCQLWSEVFGFEVIYNVNILKSHPHMETDSICNIIQTKSVPRSK